MPFPPKLRILADPHPRALFHRPRPPQPLKMPVISNDLHSLLVIAHGCTLSQTTTHEHPRATQLQTPPGWHGQVLMPVAHPLDACRHAALARGVLQFRHFRTALASGDEAFL